MQELLVELDGTYTFCIVPSLSSDIDNSTRPDRSKTDLIRACKPALPHSIAALTAQESVIPPRGLRAFRVTPPKPAQDAQHSTSGLHLQNEYEGIPFRTTN